jgi:SAM-dependent methyltransferase
MSLSTDLRTTETVDDTDVESFAEKLFGASLATLELTTAYMGRALGLYDALRGTPSRSSELAATCGIDERYAREWLEQQAAAGYVTVDDPTLPADQRRFTFPEAHAIVMLDAEHPAYTGVMADIVPIIARSLDPVLEAFRSGAGVPFAAYGLHDMQAGFTRPMFANSLADEWLGALPDVRAKLVSGQPARVADFGCGEGWASIYLAEAFPGITVDGFDLDDASIAAARRNASERGVDDRVHFEVCDVTSGVVGPYDLVMATEVIHDLSDPVAALAAMRRVTADDGEVLIIDERTADAFTGPADEVERLLYGFSVLHCLPAGRDAEVSVGTGTVMRADTFRAYAAAAGFTDVEVLPIDHPFFRFYRPNG